MRGPLPVDILQRPLYHYPITTHPDMLLSPNSPLLGALIIAASYSQHVAALGINCRGNPSCSLYGNFADVAPAEWLRNVIVGLQGFNGIDESRHYKDGEHIACAGTSLSASICAFLQKSSGAQGATLKLAAQDLINHGCGNCGSAPLNRNNNDISLGELTFNYVTDPCGNSGHDLC